MIEIRIVEDPDRGDKGYTCEWRPGNTNQAILVGLLMKAIVVILTSKPAEKPHLVAPPKGWTPPLT